MSSVGAARAVRVKELKSVRAVKMLEEKCILMDLLIEGVGMAEGKMKLLYLWMNENVLERVQSEEETMILFYRRAPDR